MDELIIENMPLAEKIGLKYAHRHKKYPPECVAEAYYCLVLFFKQDVTLYHNAGSGYQRVLGSYIKRNVNKYFTRLNKPLSPEQDRVVRNTDQEMIEYLSSIMGDERAWKVFDLLRNGVGLGDVELMDPKLRKVVSKIRLQVSSRLKRIEELKAAGIKVTREVINASPTHDEWGGNDGDWGDTGGTEHLADDPGKRDQSQMGLAA